MKLLFDENLSPRLVKLLLDVYPGSASVLNLLPGGAEDLEVCDLDQRDGFVIVTKDSDFVDLSVSALNSLPVIWVRLGNCTTAELATLLRDRRALIEDFKEGGDVTLEFQRATGPSYQDYLVRATRTRSYC